MIPERTVRVGWRSGEASEALFSREWLVTNGLGGYASGTLGGVPTRRYHGMLVAALPNVGRRLTMTQIEEEAAFAGTEPLTLGGDEGPHGELHMPHVGFLSEFVLEDGLPVWRFSNEEMTLEKRVILPHLQNTSYVMYKLVRAAGPVRITLRPRVSMRDHDARVDGPLPAYRLSLPPEHRRWEITSESEPVSLKVLFLGPPVDMKVAPAEREVFLRLEKSRGYDSVGRVWVPGSVQAELEPGATMAVVVSTESWESVGALGPDDALAAECERRRGLRAHAHPVAARGIAAELVLAADQFIITPQARAADAARAAGDDARTVIAGYPWFTDWGRDTMISLPGLTLVTGRFREAGYILRTFATYIRDGLIPNLFPEGQQEGLYHTADATLWFFQALARYVEATGDRETLRLLIPSLLDIVDHHLRGTRFGIGVDPRDGLLRQGAEGYQLTWMDAKVDGWVVTPRRGKAVEINALFYNALCLLVGWLRDEQREAGEAFAGHAERLKRSFNARFWYEQGGYLYDVVDGEDGDDSALRPNQLFAISLPHPVLDPSRWQPVVEVVRKELLTPVGLRSLARAHPDYKPQYDGDLRARDAAYHQGTVWGWLIGPFVDAWRRTHPNEAAAAQRWLEGFDPHLGDACIGSISEVFDAEAPFTPRGCYAQAWSVAEVLRCIVEMSSLPDHPSWPSSTPGL